MGGKVQVRGLEIIIKNLKDIPLMQKQHLEEAMNDAGLLLYDAVMKKTEMVEHDLNALSHYFSYTDSDGELKYIGAYSEKMGQDSGPHPDEFVHIQSGNLYRSIEKLVKIDGEKAIVAVGVSEDKVPYIKWLIDGNGRMRPRDFLGHAWLENRDKIVNIIKFGIVPGRKSRGGNV